MPMSRAWSQAERFARVLHRDLDAVYNTIEMPWTNGQAEGQINRPKTIKRAMYGRAGPELLRAACCRLTKVATTQSEKEPSQMPNDSCYGTVTRSAVRLIWNR
ncbi:hypothetical protein GHK68_09380 [Sinorhizobium meliloti]|nr:hypothetical protein [Sinorhizobium meliloti]